MQTHRQTSRCTRSQTCGRDRASLVHSGCRATAWGCTRLGGNIFRKLGVRAREWGAKGHAGNRRSCIHSNLAACPCCVTRISCPNKRLTPAKIANLHSCPRKNTPPPALTPSRRSQLSPAYPFLHSTPLQSRRISSPEDTQQAELPMKKSCIRSRPKSR